MKTNVLGLTKGETMAAGIVVVAGLSALGYLAYTETEEGIPPPHSFSAEKFSQAAKFEPIQDKIRKDLLKVFVVPGECPEKVLPPQITCNSEPAPKNITDCTGCPGQIQDIK